MVDRTDILTSIHGRQAGLNSDDELVVNGKVHLGLTEEQAANTNIVGPAGADLNGNIYDAAGNEIKLSGEMALNAKVGNNKSYYYNAGTVQDRGGNGGDRVLTTPLTLLNVGSVAPTFNATNLDVVTDTSLILRDATVRKVTHKTTAYSSVTWSAPGFSVPLNGFFYVPILTTDYITLGNNPTYQIILTCSDGTSLTYSFASSSFVSGDWAYFPIWDITTDVNGAFQRSGVSYTTGTGSIAGKAVSSIVVVANNPVVGMTWAIGSPTTGKKVKPMVIITNDVTDSSTWNYLKPALESRGFKGVFRVGGFTATSFTGSNISNVINAHTDGHDINNGTWSRVGQTFTTTEDQYAAELLLCHNNAVEFGLQRGLTLLGSAGNSVAKPSVTRSLFQKVGYKFVKCPYGTGFINTLQCGSSLPFINVTGKQTFVDLLAVYNGLKLAGGLLMHFSHEFVDSNPTGTATLKSDFSAWLDQLKADSDAGLIDVFTVSDLETVL